MARGFLFAQFFFHVSMLALDPYSIMPFIKKTRYEGVFFVSFNYCFIILLKYVQRFEFALENSRPELGYSAIYILLLALRSCCCLQGVVVCTRSEAKNPMKDI